MNENPAPHPVNPASPGGLTASPLIVGNAGGTPSLLSSSASSAMPPPRQASLHTIRFTGSGSEYFRIWIVNLLMLLVTLGLYYPWAKARKLQYFYGNTIVIGHPLAFHGDPRQMFRGFLLVSVMMVLYGVAGRVSPVSGAIAAGILALVWPALMRASLQFRLSQTSWRGLRFHFTGSLKDAYMVFLAPVLMALCTALLGVLLAVVLPRALGGVLFVVLFLVMAGAFGPYVLWRLKRYQHAHFALGQLETTFKARFPDVLKICLSTGLVTAAAGVALAVIGGLVSALFASDHSALSRPRDTSPTAMLAFLLPVVLGYLFLLQVVQAPYFTARMQNLVWTQTGNRQVRFKSHLSWLKLARLALLNWVLVLLTLGLYWPFAAIAVTRARLQAVVIHSRQDPDQLVAQARRTSHDAAGDLAADIAGLDFGL